MADKNQLESGQKARESIGHRISVLYRYTKIYVDREFAKYGIRSGQVPFLMALYRRDGVRQEALTELQNVDKATTTRAINRLESKGYVVREVDETDRRAYRIYLTEKAKKLRPVFRRSLERWTMILLKNFSESERKLLLKLLDRLAVNASEYNE